MEREDKQLLNPLKDPFEDPDMVVSATECTGLIQTPPQSEAQADSYTELYPIPKPQTKQKKPENKKN